MREAWQSSPQSQRGGNEGPAAFLTPSDMLELNAPICGRNQSRMSKATLDSILRSDGRAFAE